MDKGDIMGVMGNFANKITKINNQQQPQPAKQAENKPAIAAGTEGGSLASTNGLASSSLQPTLKSGLDNPAADSSMFGDRTNGLGVMNNGMRFNNGQQGLAAYGLTQPGTIGGVPDGTNGYNIMNGVKLI